MLLVHTQAFPAPTLFGVSACGVASYRSVAALQLLSRLTNLLLKRRSGVRIAETS